MYTKIVRDETPEETSLSVHRSQVSAVPSPYTAGSAGMGVSEVRRARTTRSRGILAGFSSQNNRADAVRDLGRRSLDGIARQVGVSRRGLNQDKRRLAIRVLRHMGPRQRRPRRHRPMDRRLRRRVRHLPTAPGPWRTNPSIVPCQTRSRRTPSISYGLNEDIHLIVTAKNGISSVELERRLGVRQATAWAMKRKILAVMTRRERDKPPLGRVEMDDAWLGGVRSGGKRGRGARPARRRSSLPPRPVLRNATRAANPACARAPVLENPRPGICSMRKKAH